MEKGKDVNNPINVGGLGQSEENRNVAMDENIVYDENSEELDVVPSVEGGDNNDVDASGEGEKPWVSKHKGTTPEWARKRFKEHSITVRELKEQNLKLMETVKAIQQGSKPTERVLSREDFPDEDAYIDYKVEQKNKAMWTEQQSAMKKQQEEQVRRNQVMQAEQQNVTHALQDLPDYHEQLQHADPDISIPVNVINHLQVSPAGPYVKYRIATDEQLSEQIKYATPQEQVAIISELHDKVLDHLIARQQPTQSQSTTNVGGQSVTRPSFGKPNITKAPPKINKGVKRDIMTLSGDEYVRERNKQLKRR